MLEQLLNRRIAARQFRLRENAVDFPVTDRVKNRDGPVFAALQFRGQMMPALQVRRDLPAAERADSRLGLAGILCHLIGAQSFLLLTAMQRIPLRAIALAFFASIILASCCTPCEQKAQARKAAADVADYRLAGFDVDGHTHQRVDHRQTVGTGFNAQARVLGDVGLVR